VWVYILKRTNNVFNKQFRVLNENINNTSINCLKTYNGGQFTSLKIENCCKEDGIERHKIAFFTSKKNGMGEHMNRNILERPRNMLNNAKLEQYLWVE